MADMNQSFMQSNVFPQVVARRKQFSDMVSSMAPNMTFAWDANAFETFINTTYSKSWLNYTDQSLQTPNQQMFIGIQFDLSQGLNYTVYYNQDLLEQFQMSNTDEFMTNFVQFDLYSFSYSLLGT